MATLASVLKKEIIRLARREARQQVADLSVALRTEKKRVNEMEKEVAALRKALMAGNAPASVAVAPSQAPAKGRKLRKGAVSTLRKRHRLSQDALSKLLGVGLNTVWSWEKGRSNPRAKAAAEIAALSAATTEEVQARLKAVGLSTGRKKPGRKPGSTKKAAPKVGKKTTRKKTAKKTIRKKATRKASKKGGRKARR